MVVTRSRTADLDKESQETTPEPSFSGRRQPDMAGEEVRRPPLEERNQIPHRSTLMENSDRRGMVNRTELHVDLGKGVTFKPDNTLLLSLPSFYGKPNENPLSFLEEYNMLCSGQFIAGISIEQLKMLYFQYAIKDKAKDWFKKLGITLNSWEDIETRFLRKYFPLSKTKAFIREIQNFSPSDIESFCESWERFNDLIRQCPHHGMAKSKLAEIFYDSLSEAYKQRVDNAAGGYFYKAYDDEVFDILEGIAEIDMQQISANRNGRSTRRAGVLHIGNKEGEPSNAMIGRKLDEITSALQKVMQVNSPLIKTKICSFCSSYDHEDGACQPDSMEQDEEEIRVVNNSTQPWNQQRGSQGNFNTRSARPAFQHRPHHQPQPYAPPHQQQSSYQVSSYPAQPTQALPQQVTSSTSNDNMMMMMMQMMEQQRKFFEDQQNKFYEELNGIKKSVEQLQKGGDRPWAQGRQGGVGGRQGQDRSNQGSTSSHQPQGS
ncbi:uncharacterized protein LOC144705374 isoform X2 [Wolffia australiana]